MNPRHKVIPAFSDILGCLSLFAFDVLWFTLECSRNGYIFTYSIWHSENTCVFNCGESSATISSNSPSLNSLYSPFSETPPHISQCWATSQQLLKLLLSSLLLRVPPCFAFSVNSSVLAPILLILPSTMSNVECMFTAKGLIPSMLNIYHPSVVPVWFLHFLHATLFILNSVQTVT